MSTIQKNEAIKAMKPQLTDYFTQLTYIKIMLLDNLYNHVEDKDELMRICSQLHECSSYLKYISDFKLSDITTINNEQ